MIWAIGFERDCKAPKHAIFGNRIYLDGKLVKSVQNSNIKSSSSPLKFGSGHDTYIAKIDRIPKILGPSDVWSKYMKNNSGTSMKDSLGNYNVNLSILKDNVVASSISAF